MCASPKILQGSTSQLIDGDIFVVFLHKYDTQLLLGKCCESVPLDCTGSYVSISMESTMYK